MCICFKVKAVRTALTSYLLSTKPEAEKDMSISHNGIKFNPKSVFVMKTLSIIAYIIGSGLLIASCFTTGVTLTWALGGSAIVCLVLGCVFQFNSNNRKSLHHYR